MLKISKFILKCFFGFNHKWEFVTKLENDEIWRCVHCKKLVYDDDLIFL